MAESSDQSLLRAYCRGDREAFDALYRRYSARLYATALRLTGQWEDAEDTLQDVFISLAGKAATIRHEPALSSWLYRATVNRAMDCLRRRRVTVSLDEDTPGTSRIIELESLRREAVLEDSSRQEDFLKQIGELIPRLPERQAAVFVLHGFQGLPHREIAAILDCSEAASKSSYCLACAKIREWVAQMQPGDIELGKRGVESP